MRKKPLPWKVIFCGTVLIAITACSALQNASSGAPIEVNLVAINDLHGHLESETKSFIGVGEPAARKIKVGGIDTIGGALNAWRAEDRQLLFVGAGDMIGATPALSSLWADEPTILALNQLKLRVSSVGNHEFDQGSAELMRYQHGGCKSTRPDKACRFESNFPGAHFPYLAANVIDNTSNQPILAAYHIEQAHGIKIAFIGAVLQGTAGIVSGSGIANVHFTDEANAINRWVPEIKAQGVSAIVVLIHQGGETEEPFDQTGCSQLRGPIVEIVKHLDPAIKLIISAHTHHGYTCQVDGRTVTQGESYGHMLTRITLTIDPKISDVSKKITAITAHNVLMETNKYVPDPALSLFLQKLKARSEAVLAKPIAHLALPRIERAMNDAGESPLGDVIADSQLAATREFGAKIAMLNQSSIREDLESGANGSNYAQLAITMPFGNTLIVESLSGAQLIALLEQQGWGHNMLQISDGLQYRWDLKRPVGHRVLPGSVTLNGIAIDTHQQYRVSLNSFIAQGGDGFSVLTQGTERLDTGINDLDALSRYLIARERDGHPAGLPQAAKRIVRVH
ncbi:bifunctional metallophosphatase/5'-nucleotidase [Glaciimonas immobilis]|uniref:5'-nucleotidase n=1 Tax=Glaciimonas immobilis TaxID=728004 RepID=A0A840RVZ2_9BURK|nr:bifunctional metallophosphatase/5'-nucleotidase [Glaciimonas immobilis]MBB5201046.1 5'-nucleotidase [Glaciimonas immobilis]